MVDIIVYIVEFMTEVVRIRFGITILVVSLSVI